MLVSRALEQPQSRVTQVLNHYRPILSLVGQNLFAARGRRSPGGREGHADFGGVEVALGGGCAATALGSSGRADAANFGAFGVATAVGIPGADGGRGDPGTVGTGPGCRRSRGGCRGSIGQRSVIWTGYEREWRPYVAGESHAHPRCPMRIAIDKPSLRWMLASEQERGHGKTILHQP